MIKPRNFVQKQIFFLVLLAVLVSPILSVLQTMPVFAAATNYPKMSALDRMKLQDGLKILEFCENSGGRLSISAGHGTSIDKEWNIIGGGADQTYQQQGGGTVPGGTTITLPAYYSTTSASCGQVIPIYASVFGIGDAKTFLDTAGYTDWNNGARTFSGACGSQRATEISCLKSAIIGNIPNYTSTWDSQMYYLRNKTILDAQVSGSTPGGCYTHWTSNTTPGQLDVSKWADNYGRSSDDGILGTIASPQIINLVNDASNPTSLKAYFVMSEGGDGNDGWQKIVNTDITTDGSKITNGGPARCESLANALSTSKSQLYIDWAAAETKRTGGAPLPPTGGVGALEEQPADPTTSSCAIDGIGWMICPVITFVTGISDLAYAFISGSFLEIDVKLLNTTLPSGAVNPTYSTWGTFRNIANVLFVAVFLIIIFSQMSSVGITNYGVKKMLPRLIIGAILVNTSYFVVQIAVDISNILGYSLKSLFELLPVYTTATGSVIETVGQTLTWAAIVPGLLAGGVALALAISIPVVLAAVLSVLMIVLILIGRQAVIIMLVIISPIAFVAWLLPNTEQWFKKWLKTFVTLLMVFPVIGLLFGASKMAATIMQAVGSSTGNELLQLMSIGIATIPLLLVPALLKASLTAVGALGAKVNGLSSKADSRVAGKAKADSRLGEVMRGRQISSMRNRAERRARPGGLQNKLDSSGIGRQLGFDRGARAAAQISDKAFEEEVSAAEITQRKYDNEETENAALFGMSGGSAIVDKATGRKTGYSGGKQISNAEQTAAARNIMKVGTSNQRRDLYVAASNGSEEVRQTARAGFYANGDQKIYGAAMGDIIQKGDVEDDAQLDDALAARLNDEGVSAETLVDDTRIAKHIARVAAAGGTATRTNANGVTKVGVSIDRAHIDKLKIAATQATTGDETKAKVTGAMADHIATIASL